MGLAGGDEVLQTERLILATGARPHIPDITGLCDTDYLTNETVMDLDELPPSLLIIGGGPEAMEVVRHFQGSTDRGLPQVRHARLASETP